MARSRRNFICITESNEVKKYASQSIDQIIVEKEKYEDQFVSIISAGLHNGEPEFEELEWHD